MLLQGRTSWTKSRWESILQHEPEPEVLWILQKIFVWDCMWICEEKEDTASGLPKLQTANLNYRHSLLLHKSLCTGQWGHYLCCLCVQQSGIWIKIYETRQWVPLFNWCHLPLELQPGHSQEQWPGDWELTTRGDWLKGAAWTRDYSFVA